MVSFPHFPFVTIGLGDHFVSFVELTEPLSEADLVEDVASEVGELFHPAFLYS